MIRGKIGGALIGFVLVLEGQRSHYNNGVTTMALPPVNVAQNPRLWLIYYNAPYL